MKNLFILSNSLFATMFQIVIYCRGARKCWMWGRVMYDVDDTCQLYMLPLPAGWGLDYYTHLITPATNPGITSVYCILVPSFRTDSINFDVIKQAGFLKHCEKNGFKQSFSTILWTLYQNDNSYIGDIFVFFLFQSKHFLTSFPYPRNQHQTTLKPFGKKY